MSSDPYPRCETTTMRDDMLIRCSRRLGHDGQCLLNCKSEPPHSPRPTMHGECAHCVFEERNRLRAEVERLSKIYDIELERAAKAESEHFDALQEIAHLRAGVEAYRNVTEGTFLVSPHLSIPWGVDNDDWPADGSYDDLLYQWEAADRERSKQQ